MTLEMTIQYSYVLVPPPEARQRAICKMVGKRSTGTVSLGIHTQQYIF